jgi:hypothetical protein
MKTLIGQLIVGLTAEMKDLFCEYRLATLVLYDPHDTITAGIFKIKLFTLDY